VGDKRGIAWSLGNLANLSSDLGDYERAVELYEEGLALCRELGGAQPLGDYLSSLGYEFLLQGDYQRAAALNEEAATMLRKQGHRGGLQYALDNLGWAALVRGDREQANSLHKESLALCRELGDQLVASESMEGLACSAGIRGEAERAARMFGAAQALREAVGYEHAPREQALRVPYLAAARARLDKALWEAAFTEGQAMTLEEAVEYALSGDGFTEDEQGLPTLLVAQTGETLTAREVEVLRLLVTGVGNMDIAEELVISLHTVKRHVANILRKLEVRTRTQAAARAREMRLV
jgi:non-specific serine/threonine protein kinase